MDNVVDTAKTYGLTHLAIDVDDIERTLKFYQSVFDMRIMYHKEDMIQLTTPGCNDIIVFQRNKTNVIGDSGGIAHFGFRLREPKDIDEFNERIINAGGKIIDKGEFVPGSPYLFFKDPDNYTVEIWYELLPTLTAGRKE
ncbi:MAG TPA: VOC family protein [Cyclobacteriaceae bacterium]|nr:VOC family protein [Cyclobacteriaceae bacterium]